ncbi:hypothetical protein [Nocardia sp. NPDC020380]|uniref:hypothetical protein n=1 Tax=Nocardia sp. NPDC020380 TaxID=3364309 RepID=UPI00378FF6EF
MDPDALRRRAQQCLQGAEHEQQRVSRTELDADYIQRLEHFGGLSHEEIHRHVRAMDPAAMHTAGDTWAAIAEDLTGAIGGLQLTVQSDLTEGMQGRLATAADTAARRFARDALDIAEITLTSGRRITAAAFAAEVVRKTVPPPPVRTTGTTRDTLPATTADLIALMTATPPADTQAFERYREEQYRQAIAALEANYTPTYPPAGARVPAFFPIDQPGNASAPPLDSSDPPGMPQPAARDGNAAPGTPDHEATTRRNQQTLTDTANLNGTDPRYRATIDSANHGGTGNADNGSADLVDQGDPSTATRAASIDGAAPSAPDTPNSPGTPDTPDYRDFPTGRGGPGTPSFPGSPRFSGMPSAPSDPGRSYPGPPHPEFLSTPRITTRPEDPTAPSTPSLYSPAGSGSSAADRTHKSPAWLVRDRTEELLGHPESTIAPVIGAEIPAARTDLPRREGDLR